MIWVPAVEVVMATGDVPAVPTDDPPPVLQYITIKSFACETASEPAFMLFGLVVEVASEFTFHASQARGM